MNVKLSRFQVGALGSIASGTITISHKAAYAVVANHVLLQKVEERYAEFFAVFGKKSYSGLGDSVEESDIYRDESFRGIKSILKGFSKVSDYPFRQEAIDLLNIIEQLGGEIESLNYSEENEKMDKLIAQYDLEENQEKLVKFNLTDLYSTLKTRHSAFKELFFQQNEANASLRNQGTASYLRKDLADALRNYFGLVTAMKSVDGWKELYTELNELAKTINKTVGSSEKSTEDKTES
ncbi:MAG: DUF6261 family protein [Paludibacter sp.]|nr:DUF6261 family protein [Paludibacter sp.]